MKWTEDRVALAVARSLFPWRRNVVVPNLSWGMGIDFEIDLGALSEAGWLTEVEIKISLQDLRREAKKWRHQRAAQPPLPGREPIVRKRYIALPLEIWRSQWNPRVAFPKLRDIDGVITVEGGHAGDVAKVARPAKPDPRARKLTDAERSQMVRLGYMRYWALRETGDIVAAGLTKVFEERFATASP